MSFIKRLLGLEDKEDSSVLNGPKAQRKIYKEVCSLKCIHKGYLCIFNVIDVILPDGSVKDDSTDATKEAFLDLAKSEDDEIFDDIELTFYYNEYVLFDGGRLHITVTGKKAKRYIKDVAKRWMNEEDRGQIR